MKTEAEVRQALEDLRLREHAEFLADPIVLPIEGQPKAFSGHYGYACLARPVPAEEGFEGVEFWAVTWNSRREVWETYIRREIFTVGMVEKVLEVAKRDSE